MSYWVYEHWAAEQKAVIHRGSCGHCNDGRGCHANPLGNKNGQWHGPFDALADARAAAKATHRPVREHRCVRGEPRDADILNECADALNAEAEDVLGYQTTD